MCISLCEFLVCIVYFSCMFHFMYFSCICCIFLMYVSFYVFLMYMLYISHVCFILCISHILCVFLMCIVYISQGWSEDSSDYPASGGGQNDEWGSGNTDDEDDSSDDFSGGGELVARPCMINKNFYDFIVFWAWEATLGIKYCKTRIFGGYYIWWFFQIWQFWRRINLAISHTGLQGVFIWWWLILVKFVIRQFRQINYCQ